jgi:thiol-disulfide isomerase/thioredoxin
MKRAITAIAILAVAAFFATVVSRAALAADPPAKTDSSPAKADTAAKPDASAKAKPKTLATPADRVVVMYFHRTKRCPTCLKMGGYSEEAVKAGFAKEIKRGKVEFHYIDFQDEKNERLTKGYGVAGPTLLVAKVAANKVVKIKNLDEMWTKVGDKNEFIEYVQSNIKDSIK